MKRGIFFLLLLFTSVLVKPNNNYALSQEEIAKLPHISAATALMLYRQGKIILLDVGDAVGKTESKFIGAYYFPSKKIEGAKIRLPKNVIIGVFCE